MKTAAAIGTLSVFGSIPVMGHDEDEDYLIDLGTGTTDFNPDDFGEQDDDWVVTESPDGTTGPAYSIEPDPSWPTHPEVNWIDYDGSGGHPFEDNADDPEGDYTYEVDFHVEEGFCTLRIHDWGVDDKAEDDGRGFYLERPDGTEDKITSGGGHGSLKGPVDPVPLTPGDHTLRVETYNAGSVTGLLVHGDVLCSPEIDIKPCSDPNAINPDSRGVIPVGIKGNEHFDPASEVVVRSLRFGAPEVVDNGGGARAAHDGHREDTIPCEGDGIDDLVVHFPTEDTGFEDGDERGKLVGETVNGTEFVAHDSVKIVGGRGSGGGPGGP